MYRNVLLVGIITLVLVIVINEILNRQFGLSWPVNGKVTSPYGNRIHPITAVKTFHNGIDISATTGTPIKAPASGIIERIFWADKGGNQLVMSHDNKMKTGYAHLSQYNVKVGDHIKRGQIIGLTGSTGKVTGPHLHLTVRNASGNYVDPQKVLK